MNIKTRRAIRMCNFLPMQQEKILGSMPAELLDQLTSKQIALVMEALNAHWHKACAWKEAKIIGDGFIWDGKELRDIAPPKNA